MAQNPKAESLSEEKLLRERLLDEKMKLIRQKNEERLKRRKEIEEDIMNANSHSEQGFKKNTIQQDHNMSGVKTERKPAVSKFRGRARGRLLEKMTHEKPQAHRFKEMRQRNNYEIVDKELQEEKTNPRTGKASKFLSDDRRADMSKITSRSSHSWGGSQFENVVDKIYKEQPRHKQDHNIDINMTGKERRQYREWKEERLQIDQQRKSRQMKGNTWHREWDQSKVHKGEHSINSHDKMQSGQKFGEKLKRADWDQHDDRNADSFTLRIHNQNRYEMSGKESSENWDENDNTKSRQESYTDVVMTKSDVCIDKEENWEEEIEETSITISKDIKISNQQQNKIISHAEKYREPQESKDPLMEEEIDTDTPQEGKISKPESLIITETLANVTLSESSTDKNATTKTNKREIDMEHPRNKAGNKCEKEPQLNEITKMFSSHPIIECGATVNTSCSGNDEEINKTTKEIYRNDASMNQDDTVKADEIQTIKQLPTEIPTKDMKNNLPKLDLSKTKEAEDIPDFLKTPQHKDWAECDFDEDELDFSSELVFYP